MNAICTHTHTHPTTPPPTPSPPRHFDFLCRYRPLPEAIYGERSLAHPLINTRFDSAACAELGESLEALPPLERLLRCSASAAHLEISNVLWEAGSDGEAVSMLSALGADAGRMGGWEGEARSGAGRGGGEGAREGGEGEGRGGGRRGRGRDGERTVREEGGDRVEG